MTTFTCDSCDTNTVDTGSSNPSLVLCADCNDGTAVWNCVDTGNHSCSCIRCAPPCPTCDRPGCDDIDCGEGHQWGTECLGHIDPEPNPFDRVVSDEEAAEHQKVVEARLANYIDACGLCGNSYCTCMW